MHFLEWKYLDFDWYVLKYVPNGSINNIPTLVKIMAWRLNQWWLNYRLGLNELNNIIWERSNYIVRLIVRCKAMKGLWHQVWFSYKFSTSHLTHWGPAMHISVSKLTIIVSDNGLSPGRCQALIWTNAGILSVGPLGTNFREILIENCIFSFKKMRLKMSRNWWPFCLSFNVLCVKVWYSLHCPHTPPCC